MVPMSDPESPSAHPVWWLLKSLAKIGCLGTIAIVLLVWWRHDDVVSLAEFFVGEGIEHVVRNAAKDMNLSASETQRLIAPVASLTALIRAGKVDLRTLRHVNNAVFKSPLTRMFVFLRVEHRNVVPSTMSDAEKEAAHQSVSRFMRGIAERKIKKETIREVMRPVCINFDWGSKRRNIVKPHPTVAELRQWVTLMDQAACANGVATGATFDLPNELEIAIRIGLERGRHLQDMRQPGAASSAPAVASTTEVATPTSTANSVVGSAAPTLAEAPLPVVATAPATATGTAESRTATATSIQ